MNPKILYYDIYNGFSELLINSEKHYLRHITHKDISLLEIEYDKALELAINHSFPLAADKEKKIIEDNIWTKEEEKQLLNQIEFLDTLHKNIKASHKISYIKEAQANILTVEKEIEKLRFRKTLLLGKTAESFANNKRNDKYIQLTLYKNKELTIPSYTDEEFGYLENDVLNEINKQITASCNQFITRNFLKIALTPHYFNYFILSKGDIKSLYGKPILDLTYNQIELFNESLKVENIFSKYGKQIPKDYLTDPDKLINYYIVKENLEISTAKNKDFVPTAMSAEDIKILGFEKNMVNLTDELNKNGGSMNFDQSLKAGFFSK